MVRGEGKGKRKKGACRNGKGFRFLNASNLCRIQINSGGVRHNESGGVE